MATSTPDVSDFEMGDNIDTKQPIDGVKEDSSDIHRETELDKGDHDGFQQQQKVPSVDMATSTPDVSEPSVDMATSTPDVSDFEMGDNIDTKQPIDGVKEDSSDIHRETELDKGDHDGFQLQQKVLRDSECEIKTLKEKVEEMERSCTQKMEDLHSAEKRLSHAKCEIKTLKEKVEEVNSDLSQEKEKLQSLQQEHNKLLNAKGMKEMEKFYQEKLEKKEEELKSFKKRVAAGMAVSLKTGGMESLNNPVSKTRLTEMYSDLKLLEWPKVKDQLKSRKLKPEPAKDIIQETFKVAHEEMKKKKQHIEEAFGLNELATQKVKEFKQLAVQNLQMALFHTSKDLLKSGFPELGGQYSEEDMVDLRPLTSECCWLSCLMTLNNPPLQPDWENLVPSMDPWDIFPQTLAEK
ncbi:tropomyosin-2-like isoform X2 [Poeciliopsis prolifica]|uniref:tropomyosin-2-like isoform X2 n=1 Tax=Poeciliopsis prolifica TaxID=188132 RepID=UPI0024132DB4|nr:tropomyosin-2-like isoform X2 [Poeciliopsis prolifica]